MSWRSLRSTTLAAALCAAAALAHAQTAPAAPHTVQAPHYGDTLFEFFQDKYFESITSLMVSQHFGRIAPHDDEAEVLRGGMLLSYGLHREAGEVFARLIERNAPPAVRDRAWYFLAKLRYQRGLLSDAEAALGRVEKPLPGELEDERLLLKAQLRMAQGDFAGAAAVLEPLKAGMASGGYVRFNLGVALVKGNDPARGKALLDELGLAPAINEEQRSLRDRANVALGFAALAGGQPADARNLLQRVRLVGPQSNKALLGFGWAAAEMKQPKDALVPWTELAARDTSDAAVLEAKIALPYAYAELGASQQALNRYNEAVDLYQAERLRLQESITAIRGGALVGALLQRNPSDRMGGAQGITDLPTMPHAGHLAQLLAGNAFQEAFKNLRDLQFLEHNLHDWQNRLGVFDDMLANRRQAYAQRLPAVLQRAGALSLPALQQRRDALAAELGRAENPPNPAAFVDAREQALLERIQRVEAALKQAGDAELSERLRRVQGALTWQLAQDFPARAWEARKALRATDQTLAEASAHDAALKAAQQDEPARFEGFAARIKALDARLQALNPRVVALGQEQQGQLQELAVAELQGQQERLDVYAAQARLAIAQLLDRAQLASRTENSNAQR
jgi:hypothetical protein